LPATAQRTTTDDVSDCINSQNDDVITSSADQHAEAVSQLGGVRQRRHHDDFDVDHGPPAVPLTGVHNGRTFMRQSSADHDEVALDRRHSTRRTLSLRRRLLTADPTGLGHDRYAQQVCPPVCCFTSANAIARFACLK